MAEMLRPQGTGISGILELARLVIPSDHEFLGFEDDDGTFYSLEQLEALEGQERQMDPIQKAIESLETSIKKQAAAPERSIKRMYRLGDMTIAIATDDTVWYLSEGDRIVGPSHWKQMRDMSCPSLPQWETV